MVKEKKLKVISIDRSLHEDQEYVRHSCPNPLADRQNGRKRPFRRNKIKNIKFSLKRGILFYIEAPTEMMFLILLDLCGHFAGQQSILHINDTHIRAPCAKIYRLV